jgi:predicted enzyme related to lactoylglutathione lyase
MVRTSPWANEREYVGRMEAVAYVVNLRRCVDFYRVVLSLEILETGDGFCRLAGCGTELTLVQVPDHIAIGIQLEDPPRRRADTPIKLVFPVADIAAARALAGQMGGRIDPPQEQWHWAGTVRCDGVDPEGNVLQVSGPVDQ